ncbi:cytochrome P450 71A22-like [Silene latifolia]|uniref:cytochrome P450 71A22-like n=1 Tax=Silene latifolia TaxID=37657 RepID=UPI003D76FA9F
MFRNMCLFVVLILVILLIVYNKWRKKCDSKPVKNPPPSPPRLPILGNLHQLGKSPYRSLESMSNKYGELMLLKLGNKPTLVVSSANVARQIMKTHDIIFSNRPKSVTVRKLCYDGRDVAFSDYGEYWRQMKSLCMIRLLSSAKVRSFGSIREEEMEIMVGKIKEANGGVVNLSEIIMDFTNDVICRAAFGRKYCGDDNGRNFDELVKAFQEALGTMSVGDFIPWLSWFDNVSGARKKVEKIGKDFDDFLEGIVEEHVARHENGDYVDKGVEQKDFVDVLLEFQRNGANGFAIDRESIKALILDMFSGGTDTSYTAIEWAMSEVLRHPNILKQLQEEVRNITKGKQDINEHDLAEMKYLKAVIKETLRLHPPDPLLVFRESTQDVNIHGYDIEARTQVIVNAWAIHRDPVSWNDPNKFDPKRFVMDPMDFRGQDFKFIPFGAGRRSCPGVSFATVSMELVLATLVKAFDWKLPAEAEPESLDMTERNGIIIHKRHPLLAVATTGHITWNSSFSCSE